VLIPNSPGGRLSMFFCSGALLGVGGLLYLSSRRAKAVADKEATTSPAPPPPASK
jgi:hypothetical protein